ncbi:MAG: type II toxin-antitoxin system VapC family toxin, partial [Gemmatimonadetes bacterium]|nr:type II toxin-antitoxin system VapC family toxin [Gemmatimonadota bacterium]
MNTPVAWLLDANVISEMMRPHPDPRVAAFLDKIADQGIGLASITVWEILNGIGLLDAGRRREALADRFQNLLDDLFEDRIYDWTLNDARECALIMEAKRRRCEALEYHLPDAF